MLPDLPDYERFIYTLPQQYGSIRGSTFVQAIAAELDG